MLPESLCKEAQKQSKAALAQVNYSYDWRRPEQGKYSIINHSLLGKNQVVEVNMSYLGMGEGWQQFRG